MVWVQPPGTPSVGHLLLDAYHATHDEYYYQAAQKVANCLIWGQLDCGGWNYVFDFAGDNSLQQWYQTVGKNAWRLEEFQHYYGNATFDDLGTISAAKFLLRMYVEKNDPVYLKPLKKVIRFVLKSQYPVGGWPQRYPLMYDHPFQGKVDYTSFITLNDDATPETIDFLSQCYQSLGLKDVKEPILRAMHLMILLQQGAPYAGWSDQYTVNDLKPAHARSYVPRSVNTGTTAMMIGRMIHYYYLTGDSRFLTGIPAAIHFIESMKLPDSEIAKWRRPAREKGDILVPRFVDPDTGKPLYVHRKGTNVINGIYYLDQNISQTIIHYSSVAYINVKWLREMYQKALDTSYSEISKKSPFLCDGLSQLPKYYTRYNESCPNVGDVEKLIHSLSGKGVWLSPLKSTSHPYKLIPDMPASEETKDACTMVGNEYDTSCYPSTTGEKAISTKEYIHNMFELISFLDDYNERVR